MLSDVGTIIDLSDDEWDFVADLFDPDGRRGTPAQHPRRRMVEAMLYLAGPAATGGACPSGSRRGRRSGPSGGAGGRTGSGRRPWAGAPGRSGPTSAATGTRPPPTPGTAR